MCGIAGIYNLQGNVTGNDIFCLTNAMKHRGPDDEGYALYTPANRKFCLYDGKDSVIKMNDNILNLGPTKGGILFGHRRLSIIDVSPAGHQPMLYDNGNFLIVFNGEIYNYIEIKNELISKGYVFSTKSDTEVLLASYKEWGTGCLSRLNGMWSFVILDVRKNILFGARDRFGVKPFYYFYSNGLFAFASEIKALLTISQIKKNINEGILYDYLMWGTTEHFDETFFLNIYKLPKAHSFTIDINTGNLDIKQYYHLNYNKTLGTFNPDEYNTHVRNIEELISNAVRLRLRADVQVGSCLSGGIDSSSLVVIMSDLLKENCTLRVGKKLKAFTACYNDEAIDESRYVKTIIEKTDAKWFQVYPTADELFRDIESLVYTQDEPFTTTSIYAQYRVMRLARESNVKVLMDGQGGDELFTGYKAHYAAFFLELMKNLRLREIVSEMFSLDNSPINRRELSITIAKHVGAKYLSADIIANVKNIINPGTTYISQDFNESYIARNISAKDISCFSVNEMNFKLVTNRGLESLLRYEDRNSMAYGIESRVPFADDIDLIQYVFSIPSIYKIHNGWSKVLLRDAVKSLLPKKICWRKDKIGFAVPEGNWFSILKKDLHDVLNVHDPYVDTQRIYKDFDKLVNSSQTNVLWRYINFILWRKVFQI